MANPWDNNASPADSDLASTAAAVIRGLKPDLPLIAGGQLPHDFGGFAGQQTSNTNYPSGSTFDKLAPNTDVVVIDSAALPGGTFKLQAMLAVDAGANTVSLALVNLSDGSPDVPVVTITSNSTTGAQVTSSAITFAVGSKTYGVKIKVSGGSGWAWGIRLIRTP